MALTMSLRTARWLPGGQVGWSPRSRRIPMGGPAISKGESILYFRLPVKHWAESRSPDKVRCNQCKCLLVGGWERPSVLARPGSVSATQLINKGYLLLKTGTGRVKCHRTYRATSNTGPNTARPREDTLSAQSRGGGGAPFSTCANWWCFLVLRPHGPSNTQDPCSQADRSSYPSTTHCSCELVQVTLPSLVSSTAKWK